MSVTLSNKIALLKSPSNDEDERLLIKRLEQIDKYFHEDKIKAHLIACLFGNCKTTDQFRSVKLKPIIEYFEKRNLSKYFDEKVKMVYQEEANSNWVVILFASLLIVLGIVRLLGGIVEVGVSDRYHLQVVSEGGLPLLIGIMLGFVAKTRYRYVKMRRQILAEIGTHCNQ